VEKKGQRRCPPDGHERREERGEPGPETHAGLQQDVTLLAAAGARARSKRVRSWLPLAATCADAAIAVYVVEERPAPLPTRRTRAPRRARRAGA
jgi:hypothetical protein